MNGSRSTGSGTRIRRFVLLAAAAATIGGFAICLHPFEVCLGEPPPPGPTSREAGREAGPCSAAGGIEAWQLPPDAAAIRGLLAELDEGYRVVRTPAFAIISDVAIDRVETLAGLAEDTLRCVRQAAAVWRVPLRRPPCKMTIVYLSDERMFATWRERAGVAPSPLVPGFFDAAHNRGVVWDSRSSASAAAGPGVEAEARRVAIRHEVAHLVMHNVDLPAGPHGPQRRWLEEGLAMRFETPEAVNLPRLHDFLAADSARDPAWWRRLVFEAAFLDTVGDESQSAYAASWALVYHLSESRLADFVSCVRGRGPTSAPASADKQLPFLLDADFVAGLWRHMEAVADRSGVRASTSAPARKADSPE